MTSRHPGRKPPARRGVPSGLPSLTDLSEFVTANPAAEMRELTRVFGIRTGPDKVALKKMLRTLTDGGLTRTKKSDDGSIPEVAVVEVTGRDPDGELLCTLTEGTKALGNARIILAPGDGQAQGDIPALGIGERFLAKLIPVSADEYEARLIRRIGQSPDRILGVFRIAGRQGRIESVSRKIRFEYVVQKTDTLDAEDGELVLGEPLKGRLAGLPLARIRERIGSLNEPKTVSLISIHAHGISTVFPRAALDEAENAKPATLSGRADLRRVPLLTIDPSDARDHDDAVWAAPDQAANNPGGFQAIVAIADVAYYVTPNSALDREAKQRGNSVYFPDRVVPMLPERLSADLCSLKEAQDRPVIAAHLTINALGEVTKHRFERAMMRSAASLSYEQAQLAIDGSPDDKSGPLLETVLKPLWACYRTMTKARNARGPLDLDLPEHKIILSPDGKVASIDKRQRLEAHRLIEEFMIQANVAAAEVLEAKHAPLIYRVHDQPSTEKLTALSDFLRTLSIKLAPHAGVKTQSLTRILDAAADTENKDLINEIMLRSQSLAIYDPANIGHFGLNLRRYAHFTSPIRRYADLIVHRSLIRHLELGDDGLTNAEISKLKETAESISASERRAMAAEREANERYLAAFMSDRIGATFWGKVSGVTRFGLFLKLDETGADGLIPMRSLGVEHFRHDTKAHALIGERSNTTYRLGTRLEVKLVEAAPLTGGLRFELATPPPAIKGGPRGAFRKAAKRSKYRR